MYLVWSSVRHLSILVNIASFFQNTQNPFKTRHIQLRIVLKVFVHSNAIKTLVSTEIISYKISQMAGDFFSEH